MINEFLCPELGDMDVDDVYFQKDGATCHTSGEAIGLLREKFPGRVISQNGYYKCPPRSYDFTPLNVFLWSCVEDKLYADVPLLIQELKEKICAVIDAIKPQMCENLMGNFIQRAWSYKGPWPYGHMSDIVLHY